MSDQFMRILEAISDYLLIFGAVVLIFAMIAPYITINTQLFTLSKISRYASFGIAGVGILLMFVAAFPKLVGNELQTITIPFEVSATQGGWQSSGVQLDPNTMVKIEVESGGWTTNKDETNTIYSSGEGQGFSCSTARHPCVEPLPDFCIGGLIAKVGEARPFSVGRQTIVTTHGNGLLNFRINDAEDGLKDNYGTLKVRITINPVVKKIDELGQSEVEAIDEWSPTGIFLEQNTDIVLEVIRGEWAYEDTKNYFNGNGSCYVCNIHGKDCNFPLSSFNRGGLVGKVGRDIYLIGQKNIIKTKQKGELLLMMNDTNLSDNRGQLVVSIGKIE